MVQIFRGGITWLTLIHYPGPCWIKWSSLKHIIVEAAVLASPLTPKKKEEIQIAMNHVFYSLLWNATIQDYHNAKWRFERGHVP